MKQLNSGCFIVFEGIDGSGKTTLAHAINQELAGLSMPTLLTKEPGGSNIGRQIRKMLQDEDNAIDSKAEFLLFAADRAEHVKHVIKPALEKKHIVLSDRYIYSSIVYQGYGRGLPLAMINSVNEWATEKLQPDIVFYLLIDQETARERTTARGKQIGFDGESTEFFKHLLEGYQQALQNAPNVITLDSKQSTELLTKTALNAIVTWLNNK